MLILSIIITVGTIILAGWYWSTIITIDKQCDGLLVTVYLYTFPTLLYVVAFLVASKLWHFSNSFRIIQYNHYIELVASIIVCVAVCYFQKIAFSSRNKWEGKMFVVLIVNFIYSICLLVAFSIYSYKVTLNNKRLTKKLSLSGQNTRKNRCIAVSQEKRPSYPPHKRKCEYYPLRETPPPTTPTTLAPAQLLERSVSSVSSGSESAALPCTSRLIC